MELWELWVSALAALVWVVVGLYFYTCLAKLWGELLLMERRNPNYNNGLLQKLGLWPGVPLVPLDKASGQEIPFVV